MNIYLACSLSKDKRQCMFDALKVLRDKGFEVYAPIEHFTESAWDWPNNEWAIQVFRCDIEAIKRADVVVCLNWGRNETSAGTVWEHGYAYGIGKKVILVEMTENVQSLMVGNGRYATVKGIKGLEDYNFDKLPKTRTNTEQL